MERPDLFDPAIGFVWFREAVFGPLLERASSSLYGRVGSWLEQALDGCSRDAVSPGQLAETLSAAAITEDGFAIHFDRFSADVPSFEAGPAHAGADPLDNQVALQLGYGADDDDDGPTQRAGCVDRLAERDELDVRPVQFVQYFEELPYRAGDPIRGPDQDHIDAAAAGIPHQLIEPRPSGLASGDPIGVFVHDLEAALGGQSPKIPIRSMPTAADVPARSTPSAQMLHRAAP